MIIQRSLTIHNGCQHKDLHVDFMSGSTYAITGKNACGKTNMLQLNMYGLLGIVNKSWGSQKDFNRNGTKDGYVEVCIQNTENGNLVYICRHFTAGTKNPDRLWYNDTNHDPDVMGRDAIDVILEGIYGVPLRILFDLLWMRQGMTNWLLTSSSTSIYTFMNSIFDTSRFKRIREVLMDAANSIALYEVDHARCKYLEDTIKALESKTYEDTGDLSYELNMARERLANVNTPTISERDKKLKLEQLFAERERVDRDIVDATNKLAKLDTNPVPWLTDEHRTFYQQFDEVGSRQSQVEAELAKETWGWNNTNKDIERVDGLIKDITKHLQSVDDSLAGFLNSDVCPLCTAHVLDHNVFRMNVVNVFAGSSYEESKKRRTALDLELSGLKSNRLTVEGRMKDLKQASDTIRKYIADNTETHQRIGAAIHEYTVWERSKSNRDAYINIISVSQTRLSDIDMQIAETSTMKTASDDDAQFVYTLKAKIRELESKISSINAEKIADETTLRSCQSELNSRYADKVRNEHNQNMFNKLMRLREGTSNKRIPARYLNDKVTMLNTELEAYCKMAQMPVILFLDPEDFVFRFTDGNDTRPAGQLSGAQQTLCSTILQLALVRVVNPRLGVIQIDEPTVFLDPTNRGKLLALFDALASVVSAGGTTTLVPTHDQDLITACKERLEL